MAVLLILVDGMRPDAIPNHPAVERVTQRAFYTMQARTVLPSKTLPCIMSLFQGVGPQAHRVVTNVFTSRSELTDGLCEVLSRQGKSCALFYNWEPLRDVSRPGSAAYSCCSNGEKIGFDKANQIVTDQAISYLADGDRDFVFLYLGNTDAVGHRCGWMSQNYLDAVKESWDLIETVLDSLTEDDTVIITADHGGHDKSHGVDVPEDMTIPLMVMGKTISPGEIPGQVSILDIAPTIVNLLGAEPNPQWEGKNLL